MFGYITPDKPELKVKEHDLYKAAYCGICKSIGRKYGLLARTSVTYDAAFLALLHSAVTGKGFSFSRERCILHPLAKRYCAASASCTDYASDMNIVLAYFNLRDKWKDDGSIPAAVLHRILRRAYRRVRHRYPDKCGIFEKLITQLDMLEKSGCASMDMAAEPFARLLEEVMNIPDETINDKTRESLKWLGYNAGKWIYTLDAYDDLDKDAEKGTYNPLIRQFGDNNPDMARLKNTVRDRVEFSLTHSLSEIAKSFELMDIKSKSGIIENVVYLGMLRKTDGVLNKGSCNKVDQSI